MIFNSTLMRRIYDKLVSQLNKIWEFEDKKQ